MKGRYFKMFWIVASLLAVLVLFVALGYSKTGWRLCGRQVLCLFGLVLVLGGMVATVPTGHTGILTTFGKVEDKTLEAGMHMKSPFQEIVCMDNRTQVAHLELSAFSSDIQEVLVSYSMNYQIEKSNAQKGFCYTREAERVMCGTQPIHWGCAP